ncbi:hypothetical protein LC040_01605 [Bacillus tianshenii]|nr:hypothetical protein LC040_01605 [Bacillus tianshenii]
MGYILPINHQQYREYRKREESKDKPQFPLEPVERVARYGNVRRNNEEDLYDFNRAGARIPREMNYDHLVKEVEDEIVDTYFAEITGRGLNFNEYV